MKKSNVRRSPKRSIKRSPKRSLRRSPRRSIKRSPRRSIKRSPRRSLYRSSPSSSLISSPSSDNSIILRKSTRPDKKFMVTINNSNSNRKKTIHFGANGMSDFTLHKDVSRKENYISRHKKRENWNKSGIETAGFWSLNLLWNKPTISQSIKDIQSKFNVKIKYVS